MLFKVSTQRIQSLINDYLPYNYFIMENVGNGYTEYMIDDKDLDINQSEFFYNANRKHADFKTYMASHIKFLVEGVGNKEYMEELNFLFFHIAAVRKNLQSQGNEIEMIRAASSNLIKLKLLIREVGLDNLKVELKSVDNSLPKERIAVFQNLNHYYTQESFLKLFTNHLQTFAIDDDYSSLIDENTSPQVLESIANKYASIDELKNKKIIGAKGLHMITNYLIQHLDYKKSANVKTPFAGMIYDIYYRFGWVAKPDEDGKLVDKFRHEVEFHNQKSINI